MLSGTLAAWLTVKGSVLSSPSKTFRADQCIAAFGEKFGATHHDLTSV